MSRLGSSPLRTASVALVAAAVALTCTASASAANGAWTKQAGIKRLHFETAPISIRPGQNTVDNVTVPAREKPSVDGYLVRMKPDLQYLNGKVPPVDVIHLHHGVWLNATGSSPASPFGAIEPIFFGGEEKTVFNIPKGYGYAYRASDTWILNQMIHNNTANAAKVKLVWDLDFIPATTPLAKKVKAVTPLWMDVRRGWGYPVFDTIRGAGGTDGEYTFPQDEKTSPYRLTDIQNEFTMPWSGTIVSAVGHLHPGGLRDDIDVIRSGATPPTGRACRTAATNITGTRAVRRCVTATRGMSSGSTRIFRTQAKYYDPAGPVSWDVSLTASRPDWRVRVNTGDTIRISTTYENKLSSWYENMGLALLYVAKDDTTGLDPFATPVDWRGVLTHGHLPENNNHGGAASGLADPRKTASGPTTTEVDIKNYQFRPGDLGLLSTGGKVPTVPAGQRLKFVNQDNAAYEWHSITTCAAPCNRQTGISYPLANASNARATNSFLQLDSGQLGFGPAGASPAANRLDYETPADLPKGTYTYFCRVHNFMRGSFRVIDPL